MKLVICLDDKGGMAFLKKRVSRDKILIENLAAMIGDDVLYIEPYSEELFSEVELNIICSTSPLAKAEAGDYVFLELSDPAPAMPHAEELIIYKWNRAYPSNLKFTAKPENFGFHLVDTVDFPGSSHEKISREIYKRG